jgi:copper chaperone CopZ
MKKFNLVIAVISTIFFISCGSSSQEENASNTTDKIVEASFEVSGNCGMCQKRIEKAAKGVDGIETAVWDKETKQLKVTHKEGVNIHTVHQAVADAGHDTEMHKAKDDVYSNLPGCCQYRSGNPHEGHDH